MAWEIGRRTAPASRRRARGAVPRGGRAGRGGAGARRLPQHAVRPAGPGAALVRPRVGARAVLPRPPVPGGRRPGAHAARRRRRPRSTSPAARPTSCATCSARAASSRICGHAEVEVGPGGARPGDSASRATSSRRACSSSATATARCATSSGVARTTRTTSPCATPTCCAATRCGRTTSPRAPPTSPSRRATTSCSHALDRQWDTTVARRTYVTGGQGSHHQDEAFGEDWELPSDRAYSETCAGVGIRDVQLAAAARRRATRATRT